MRGGTTSRVVLALALLCGLPGVAHGQDPSRQTAKLLFDQQRPATGTGVSLAIDYVNTDDPAAKPPAVEKIVLELAPGTAIDDSVPERCDASDQELIATGSAACPAGSVVGGGEIEVDTGVEGPARVLANDVTIFNSEGEIVLLLESSSSPRRLVVRGPIEGSTITTEVPPTPGGPPDGFSAVKRVRLRLEPRSAGSGADARSYITTPSACPADGVWPNTATFTYRDGASYAVPSPSACAQRPEDPPSEPVDSAAPRIRIQGVPRAGCVRRGLRVRVRIAERGSGLRRAVLTLDRRRLANTRRSRFSRRVGVARLRAGRHRLSVVAIDNAGNRAKASVRFRRCRR